MYAADTILELKVPREADPETKEEFAYNRVKVVGPSPVAHADKGDWTGGDAAGVIIVPLTNFGGTLDEPFGKLRELYNVAEMPPEKVQAWPPPPQPIRRIDAHSAEAGRTPEEIFAAEAPGKPDANHPNRARSPLGEPGGPAAADGPLGPAPSGNRRRRGPRPSQ